MEKYDLRQNLKAQFTIGSIFDDCDTLNEVLIKEMPSFTRRNITNLSNKEDM